MNKSEEFGLLQQACEQAMLPELLEEYIAFCYALPTDEPLTEKKGKKYVPAGLRFPNLAGFCRYIGSSIEEWTKAEQRHPKEFGRLRAVLEDEALNAAMSPTVISAYLKKRLGYDGEDTITQPLQIQFEHDIFGDGE